MNRCQQILTVAVLALFCASLATGQLAQGTNAVTITHEEFEALVQYHTDRLDTTNAIALTAGEWAVLNKYREDEAAERAKEAAEVAHRKALTRWQRVKAWYWEHPIIGTILFVCLAFVILERPIEFLYGKWRDWRFVVLNRKYDRKYRKNNP